MHQTVAFASLFIALLFTSSRADPGKIEPISDGYLLSVGKCLNLYFRDAFLQIPEVNLIRMEASNVEGSCDNNLNGQIKISWNLPGSQNFTEAVFTFNIAASTKNEGFWNLDQLEAEFTKNDLTKENYKGIGIHISSQDKFSYSCNSQIFSLESPNNPNRLEVQFNGFQLQPFDGEVFAESFDCSNWFTLDMWMGLIVVLLTTMIILLGVCMINNIQTCDRFEDPKSKGLYIPSSE